MRHGATSKSGFAFVSIGDIFVHSPLSYLLQTVRLTVTYLCSFVLSNSFTFLIVRGQVNHNNTLYSIIHFIKLYLFITALVAYISPPHRSLSSHFTPTPTTLNKQRNKTFTPSSSIALRQERITTTIFNQHVFSHVHPFLFGRRSFRRHKQRPYDPWITASIWQPQQLPSRSRWF